MPAGEGRRQATVHQPLHHKQRPPLALPPLRRCLHPATQRCSHEGLPHAAQHAGQDLSGGIRGLRVVPHGTEGLGECEVGHLAEYSAGKPEVVHEVQPRAPRHGGVAAPHAGHNLGHDVALASNIGDMLRPGGEGGEEGPLAEAGEGAADGGAVVFDVGHRLKPPAEGPGQLAVPYAVEAGADNVALVLDLCSHIQPALEGLESLPLAPARRHGGAHAAEVGGLGGLVLPGEEGSG
mmetsp:Transcript_21161/g.58728  ORF Transcript_21161/g.58728 Transcript_21161/m.58728 type:complete len:236 (-) Transcript_21161:4746-5453(-)